MSPSGYYNGLYLVGFQVATEQGRNSSKKDLNHADVESGTAPPSESETNACQAYQVQLIRGRSRLIPDHRCDGAAYVSMNMRDFDSISQIIGGVEVAASPPDFPSLFFASS